MNNRKRRLSADSDEPSSRNARSKKIKLQTDVNLNPNMVFSEAIGNARLIITLKSMWKAECNDPTPLLSPYEPIDDKNSSSFIDDLFMKHRMGGNPALAISQDDPNGELLVSEQHVEEMAGGKNSSIQEDEQSLETTTVAVIVDAEHNSSPRASPSDLAEDASPAAELHDYDEHSLDEDAESENASSKEDEEHIDDSDTYSSSEDDFCSEFDWLECINVNITSEPGLDGDVPSTPAGSCQAKLIRRDAVCHNFYEELEQPCAQTCWFAFELFDRYGRLKPEYMTHPTIRGNGVWNRELDTGDLLLIEELFIQKNYRRQGFGRRMVEALLKVTERKTRSLFAIVWPSILQKSDIGAEFNALDSDAAKDDMEAREESRAIAFYRSTGFRRIGDTCWLAMATDPEHPSRRPASDEDFDPPKAPLTSLHPLLQPFQQVTDPPSPSFEHFLDLEHPPEPDYLGVLHKCLSEKGSSDACWKSTDRHGNNVLHLALKLLDVACVKWILDQDFGPQLCQLRNHRGETPLECLCFQLEKGRTQRRVNQATACVSDNFRGYPKSGVHSLVLLEGYCDLETYAKAKGFYALQQKISGCTCGQCIQGVLSPRMSDALHTQACSGYDIMFNSLREYSGPEWVDHNETYLYLLTDRLRRNLSTNKSVRQGFATPLEPYCDMSREQKIAQDVRGIGSASP